MTRLHMPPSWSVSPTSVPDRLANLVKLVQDSAAHAKQGAARDSHAKGLDAMRAAVDHHAIMVERIKCFERLAGIDGRARGMNLARQAGLRVALQAYDEGRPGGQEN